MAVDIEYIGRQLVRQGVLAIPKGKHQAWQARFFFPSDSLLHVTPTGERPYHIVTGIVIAYLCGDVEQKAWMTGHYEQFAHVKLTDDDDVCELTTKFCIYRVLPAIQAYYEVKDKRLDSCKTKEECEQLRKAKKDTWNRLKDCIRPIVATRFGGLPEDLPNPRLEIDKMPKLSPKMGKNARKRAQRYAEIDAARAQRAKELKALLCEMFDKGQPIIGTERYDMRKHKYVIQDIRERHEYCLEEFRVYVKLYLANVEHSTDDRLYEAIINA